MVESTDLVGLPELTLLAPGTVFGNYVVHECIGQGAMGSVYRAVHALLAKPVALKIMDAALLGSSDARQRFLREGQAAASIKHPNVVDITDVGFMDTTPYLVMELLEGEDLETYLDRARRLSEDEATDLFVPIIAALAVAHDSGVVHRDIKPSNIFLALDRDGEMEPKVLDFGISKLSRALASKNFGATPFNQLMGSPLYLPPEAVQGCASMTSKSDQYALGVVLYECLTGEPPFDGDNLLSVLNSITAGSFAHPRRSRPELSVEIENAILRAMHPDPAQRFEHVRDFGRALLEVASVRTQVRWGRAFGRRDLSDAPRSLPASALSIAAPARPPSQARNLALGAAVLSVLVSLAWSRSPSPSPSPAPEPSAGQAPSVEEVGPREPAPRAALATAQEPSPAVVPRTEPAPTARGDERSKKSRRQTPAWAVRAPLPMPPSERREVSVSPPAPEADDLDPFSIRRVSSPPAPVRPVTGRLRGANEAPILD